MLEVIVFGKFKDHSLKDMKKYFMRAMKRPFYSGNEYECTVCETGVSSFKPAWKSLERELSTFIYPVDSFETFNRKALICPACDASDRDRLCALYFRERLASSGGRLRVLDFAPNLANSRWLRGEKRIDYYSADLFRPKVDLRLDIQNMHELADQSFDALICSHVLEHVPDDKAAMRELYRILKQGGFAIIMVPLVLGVTRTQEDPSHDSEALRKMHYAQCDHLRLYGTLDFVEGLESVGFSVRRLDAGYFGLDLFRKAAITGTSALYVATKP